MKLSHVAAAFSLLALSLPLAGGCSNDMDPKECGKLREEAFELLNKAQHCNTDADCRQSDWPGCAKPVSMVSYDKIKSMHDPFTKGKCQEPKSDCRESPTVYCKQGLCVHREKGTPEGAGNTPTDQIIIK
ncbi:MAG: hypothetical protein QM820_08595 [Minicystis sp.]